MAETNQIEVIEEEQKIVEEETPEEKSVEGFSHLTKEDLDADYVKPQEEAESKEEPTTTKTEESDTSESDSSDSKEEVSSKEWSINGTSYTEDDLGTRMIKDYQNLTSFVGKQAEEIGKMKQQLAEAKEEKAKSKEPEKDPTPKKDKDYDIYTSEGIQEIATDSAKRIVNEQAEAATKAAHAKRFTDDAASARAKFVERHPEYKSEEAIVSLIKESTAKGIALGANADSEIMTNYLETAHSQKTGDFSYFIESSGKTIDETATQTMNKINEGKKVKETLTKVNSAESSLDYDALTDDEWAKLPQEKRNELLEI